MTGSFRNYGKIDPYVQFQFENKRKARRRIFIIVASSLFLVAVIVCVVAGVVVSHRRSSDSKNSSPENPQFSSGTSAIQLACNTTLYPDTCEQTLSTQPGASTANPLQLVTIAVQVALKSVQDAYNYSLSVSKEHGLPTLEVVAAQDCEELMDAAMEELNVSISKLSNLGISSLKSSLHDVQVFLSSASSDQAACEESLRSAEGSSISSTLSKQEFVSEVILNALGLVQTLSSLGSDISSWKNALPSIPDIFHFRRRLLSAGSSVGDRYEQGASFSSDSSGYPQWLSAGDRQLLQAPTSSVQGAQIIVATDGSGQYKKLKEALDNVPEDRNGRITIYVKAGIYEEGPINITKVWADLTLIGDGCNQTVITGSANVASGKYTTYRSATVGIAAKGFIAKDITFRNTAGPTGSQAVAVRIAAEEVVFDNCCFEGYQDTLYPISGRQFFTQCKIMGTVDFIFGNALAVFQSCELIARQPGPGQQNTYTAQGKKQKELVTGFSFQNCTLSEGDDLKASTYNVSTYFGRPWKEFSTSIFMQSNIGSHVSPAGWLSWNTSEPFQNTCYYAEYDNFGLGSDVSKRVPWGCVHRTITDTDASQFTVEGLLSGTTWIPSDVQYISGLTS